MLRKTLLLLLATSSFASGFGQTLRGTILDADGNPLPSASVILDGSSGQFANLDGQFSIDVPKGKHEITFSFIGYISQNRTILMGNEDFEWNITLEEDAILIDDVVVVGYGVQRKKEVTGSIVQVSSKQITGIQTPSFEAALQGQAAGVQVSQSSGVAGAPSLIRVRGVASVSAAGDPLYVIDGIPITQEYFLRGNSGALNNNPLASINPNDIESVEILKDAAATGIYGSRGANGVILITTKRGKKGTTFEFSTRAGFGGPATRPNMVDTETYLSLRQEAWENDGGTGYVWLPNITSANDDPATRQQGYLQALQTNTNWVDETTGVGTKGNVNFGVRHGGEHYNVYAGISQDNNGSYLLGNSYNRSSARLNLDWSPQPWAKVILSSSFSRGQNNRIDAAWSGGLGDAMSNALPYYPIRYAEDELDANGIVLNEANEYFLWFDEWGGSKNPVAVRQLKQWKNTEDRSINNAQLILTPWNDFHLKFSGGFDYLHLKEDLFNPGALSITTDLGSANRNANYVLNWNYSATADYQLDLDSEQSLNFLIGSEFQRTDNYGYGLYYGQVDGPVFAIDSLAEDAANVNRTANLPSQHSFLSYFGRVNYAIKDRYFFQATARVDGSSRFGRESRYGFFPSLSAGWVISDESWFSSQNISFLKFRSSIGFTGNAALPDYARFGTYSPADNGNTYAGDSILYPIQPENPFLRWETSRTIDASLEMGLLQDRITLELAGYHKYSTDVLMNVSTPASTGFTNFWDNVGTILNRGIEFTVKSRNLTGAFQWNSDLNISRNYNELIDIGDYTPDAVSGGTNDSRVIVGRPVGSFYLVEHSHVDPETGLPVYLDLNGNETLEYSNDIRKYVGDGLPDIIGGLNNTFRFKNWDLSALATFSIGAKIFDSSAKRQLGVVSGWNMREEKLDRWRQPGDEALYPRLTLDETTYGLPSGFPWWNTSLFIYDASYIRLRNIALGFNVPLPAGSAMSACRVALNATNLFTITNFPGLDPEVVRDFENAQDRNLSPNVTYLTPPQERTITLSISTQF